MSCALSGQLAAVDIDRLPMHCCGRPSNASRDQVVRLAPLCCCRAFARASVPCGDIMPKRRSGYRTLCGSPPPGTQIYLGTLIEQHCTCDCAPIRDGLVHSSTAEFGMQCSVKPRASGYVEVRGTASKGRSALRGELQQFCRILLSAGDDSDETVGPLNMGGPPFASTRPALTVQGKRRSANTASQGARERRSSRAQPGYSYPPALS